MQTEQNSLNHLIFLTQKSHESHRFIHRYRSYVTIRMGSTSDSECAFVRFVRFLCEIQSTHLKQKSARSPPPSHHPPSHQLTKDCSGETSERIEKEIPPLGSTSRRERLLTDLDQATKKDRRDDSTRNETSSNSIAMTLEIFEPKHATEAEVHQKVQHLINIRHLIEWSLWRIEEREKENHTKDKNG